MRVITCLPYKNVSYKITRSTRSSLGKYIRSPWFCFDKRQATLRPYPDCFHRFADFLATAVLSGQTTTLITIKTNIGRRYAAMPRVYY